MRPGRGRDENGNGLIMLITLMPVILLAFGVGLDTARAMWVRQALQKAVDQAAVAGAATTRIDAAGGLVIDTVSAPPNEAFSTTRRFYALNRPGAVLCTGDRAAIPGTDRQRCWTEPATQPLRVSADGQNLFFMVRERSPHSGFLRLAGLTHQDYNLISRARIVEQSTAP